MRWLIPDRDRNGIAIVVAILLLSCTVPAFAQESGAATQRDISSAFPKPVAPNASDSSRPALEHRSARYHLCPSDVISVEFPLTPEFNQSVNIQPDGFASLSGAGAVLLEGLTPEQAVSAIQAAYAKILHEPIVTVELKDFNKPYFMVSGRFTKAANSIYAATPPPRRRSRWPADFRIRRSIRKFCSSAARQRLVRGENAVDVKRFLQGHDVSEDPEIRPGDLLFVPQNLISKIKKFIPTSGMGAYYQN